MTTPPDSDDYLSSLVSAGSLDDKPAADGARPKRSVMVVRRPAKNSRELQLMAQRAQDEMEFRPVIPFESEDGELENSKLFEPFFPDHPPTVEEAVAYVRPGWAPIAAEYARQIAEARAEVQAVDDWDASFKAEERRSRAANERIQHQEDSNERTTERTPPGNGGKRRSTVR